MADDLSPSASGLDGADAAPQVEIYTSPLCGFCFRAKKLLDKKGVSYTEYDVLADPSLRATMTTRADGRRTVPQIFIGGQGVGGSDDLYALERAGKLDGLLGRG